VNNIKMDRRELGWDGMDWIDLSQDRGQWRSLANTVMNLRVSQNAVKFSVKPEGSLKQTKYGPISFVLTKKFSLGCYVSDLHSEFRNLVDQPTILI
jgi:hypothetical protein